MDTDFLLYLDVLGFENLCVDCDPKVEQIYDCLLEAKRAHSRAYKIVIFSDTILVKNIGVENPMYSLMFLCEFFTDLQYRLSKIGVFVRGVIKNGVFSMERREDVEVFYGPAIIEAYRAEKAIKAIGLFMCAGCSMFNRLHTLTEFDERHYFVQTLIGVDRHATDYSGRVEVPSFVLEETDQLCFLKDDVQLLQQISEYRLGNSPADIVAKHEITWQLLRVRNASLLDALEEGNFDLSIINDEYDWSRMGRY